jgi:hypothetical protein
MASNKIQDFRSGLQVKCNPDGTVTLGNKNWRFLTTAITANSTTTSLDAGTFGSTSHATGRDKIFVSDGTKWQNFSPGSSIADAVADTGALTSVTLTDNGGGTADNTVASQAAPVTLTDSTGLSGTHDDTLAATTVPSDLTGGEAPTEAEHNALLAVVRVMAQNQSDLAQKIIEIVTLETTARNNLKEVTTQLAAERVDIAAVRTGQLAILASLRAAGQMTA